MVKRVVSLLAAVFMVCASSFSASAWDADSFVADSPNYYKLFPESFSTQSVSESSSDSLSSYDIFYNGTWLSTPSLIAYIHLPEQEVGYYPPTTLPALDLFRPYPDSGLSLSLVTASSTTVRWQSDFVSIPISLAENLRDGGEITGVGGLYGTRYDSDDESDPNVIRYGLEFQFDISSLGSFDTFEIGGIFRLIPYVRQPDGSISACPVNRIDLHVNGSLYTSFSADSSNYVNVPLTIVSYPESVSSISFVVVYEPCSEISWSESAQYSCYVGAFFTGNDSDLSLHVLNGEAALDGYTDEAQDSINQHDQIEADWVGQMDENFNSLDLDTASYPSGLVSGFQLLSGIFMDIWNGLGDLHLIFTIPLTLGIVLVLIGRISKAVSNRSGRAEEKGDNSA